MRILIRSNLHNGTLRQKTEGEGEGTILYIPNDIFPLKFVLTLYLYEYFITIPNSNRLFFCFQWTMHPVVIQPVSFMVTITLPVL